MAEIDVAADPPLGPQPFDGGVHVDGVPGDDGIGDQVEAEDLIRLLICLTALYLPFVRALVHESELARNEPDSQVHHLPRAYDDGLPSSAIRLRM